MKGALATGEVGKPSLSREVVRLAAPAIATSLLQTFVFVVDRMMLGAHGKTSLAAMQLAGPAEWAVLSIFLAFEVGTLARVGNLVGKKDPENARRAAIASIALAVGSGLVLTMLAPAVRYVLPLAAPYASADVTASASDYLELTLAASPLAFVGAATIATLQASGDTRTPLVIGAFANLVHVATNRVLIMGAFGVPAMGARGAGFSAVVMFAIEAALGALALLRHAGPVSLRRRARDSERGSLRTELLAIGKIGWPAMLERIVYHAGTFGYVGIIAFLGDVPMAANQALISIESVCFLSADGFGVAAASMVARKLGASARQDAIRAAWLSARWAAVGLTSLGLLALAGGSVLLPLFSKDAAVVATGLSAMPVLAFAQPFMAFGIVLSQAFRGAGLTRVSLATSLAGALVVRLVFTYVFAIRLNLGLAGVWMGSTADWMTRSILLLFLGVRRARET